MNELFSSEDTRIPDFCEDSDVLHILKLIKSSYSFLSDTCLHILYDVYPEWMIQTYTLCFYGCITPSNILDFFCIIFDMFHKIQGNIF